MRKVQSRKIIEEKIDRRTEETSLVETKINRCLA